MMALLIESISVARVLDDTFRYPYISIIEAYRLRSRQGRDGQQVLAGMCDRA
jgi:hypothetical protein